MASDIMIGHRGWNYDKGGLWGTHHSMYGQQVLWVEAVSRKWYTGVDDLGRPAEQHENVGYLSFHCLLHKLTSKGSSKQISVDTGARIFTINPSAK